MKIHLVPCDCGASQWVEIELPHGVPYYKCENCGIKKPANEVEKES